MWKGYYNGYWCITTWEVMTLFRECNGCKREYMVGKGHISKNGEHLCDLCYAKQKTEL